MNKTFQCYYKKMEGVPKRKPISQLGKGVRAALTGAVFLGTAGMVDPTRSDAAPLKSSVEKIEMFNIETEIKAFMTHIKNLEDSVIQDARGRRTLTIIIEEKLGILALSLQQQKSYFSKNTSNTISGSVTLQAREQARQLLLQRIPVHSDNFALQTLRDILNPRSVVSPELKKRLGDW